MSCLYVSYTCIGVHNLVVCSHLILCFLPYNIQINTTKKTEFKLMPAKIIKAQSYNYNQWCNGAFLMASIQSCKYYQKPLIIGWSVKVHACTVMGCNNTGLASMLVPTVLWLHAHGMCIHGLSSMVYPQGQNHHHNEDCTESTKRAKAGGETLAVPKVLVCLRFFFYS